MGKRISHYKAILVRPLWILVAVYVFGGLGILQSVREEFLSPEWQERLRVMNILPQWPVSTWIIIVLIISVLVILESAHRQMSRFEKIIDKYEDKENVALARKVSFEAADNSQDREWMGIIVINEEMKTFSGRLYVTHINGKKIDDPVKLAYRERAVDKSDLEIIRDGRQLVELGWASNENYFIRGINTSGKRINAGKNTITTNLLGSYGEIEINAKPQDWIVVYNPDEKFIDLRKVENERQKEEKV